MTKNKSAFIGERLVKLRDNLGISQVDFAKSIGITQGALSHMETNRSGISSDLVIKICTRYDLDSNWLLMGSQGPRQQPDENVSGSMLVKDIRPEAEGIALIKSEARASYPSESRNDDFLKKLSKYQIPGFSSEKYLMFEVSGISMEPAIYDGDIVIVERFEIDSTIHDGEIYVVVTEKEVLIKRLYLSEKESNILDLCSDNRKYKPIQKKRSEIIELFEVKGKITKNIPQAQYADMVKLYEDLADRVNSLEKDKGKARDLKKSG